MARGIGWSKFIRRRAMRRRALAESIATAILTNRNLAVDVVCLDEEEAKVVLNRALELLKPMVMNMARRTA